MKRLAPSAVLSALLLCSLTATAVSPAKKRVLILGDSISIGYTPVVQKKMSEDTIVLRPMKGDKPENCSDTVAGTKNIDRWLEIDGGHWNVIHFNWGLHDVKHMANGKPSDAETDPPNSTVEAYEKQLREIVGKLKATGAKLIFATTTPAPAGTKPYRSDADVVKYNEAALRIMKENDIAVDDLYTFVKARQSEIQRPQNVHFTEAGSEALGEEVVKSIRAALK